MRLVREFDVVAIAPSGSDATRKLVHCDGVFGGFSDLPLIRQAYCEGDAAGGLTKAVSLTGPPGSLTAEGFEAISEICNRLELELASHQSDPCDFGRDKEVTFLLARRADRLIDGPYDALKLALLLEAHSVQTSALYLLRRYNVGVDAAQQLDEALIDRTYEVEPFVVADHTRSTASAAAAASVAPQRRPARRLSIHCDLLHRRDGEQRLRRLAQGLALPAQAELIVRVPGPTLPASLPRLTEEIARSAVAIKIFQDSGPSDAANPCAGGFLSATGAEAELAIYYDGEGEPGIPGWDYDLLRAAAQSEGQMIFALRTGDHKTRYYAAPEDAEAAPEPVPAVSRAWLQACETWSVPGVSPGVFQALVGFYFGRVDWMNKHRLLRSYPVVSVPVVASEADGTARSSPRRFRRSAVSPGAEEKAIEAALRMHAIEWCSREHLHEPDFVYDRQRRRLVLRQRGQPQVLKSWRAEPDRTRLPL
jgi:hypothetical protein